MKTLSQNVFCTTLDTEQNQMGIKYSMEGFIKYKKINMVGNSKRGFTDHNASGRSLILRSVITIADEEDQHCSCIAGLYRLNECTFNQINIERHWNVDLRLCVFVFICIGVEYLGTFCSVLFGFRKFNKIYYIAYPLRIPGISVSITTGTQFFHFWSINPIKPMQA